VITLATQVIAGISWDPEIRGILAVGVGVAVLMGSVYLLLGTNVGNRLGFLLATTGFMGWMTIMGLFWWIQPSATGPAGDPPAWRVIEVNYGDLGVANLTVAHELDVSAAESAGLPSPKVLRESTAAQIEDIKAEVDPATEPWRLVAESDKMFGEAKSVVDAELTNGNYVGLNAGDAIDSADDFVAIYTFDTGGKDKRDGDSVVDRVKNRIEQTAQLTHPEHYLILQVCPTTSETRAEAALPGQKPPTPTCDESAEKINVIMVRDIGERRLPVALVTLGSGTIFGLLCYMLHVRDRRVAEHVSAPLPLPAKV
jgi:hypothetical protein